MSQNKNSSKCMGDSTYNPAPGDITNNKFQKHYPDRNK